ncbi:hypothetical protein ACQW02_19715 [Humitalea sp. 24SJ18S-53]|uniref:hypothetical protein n=1 Tax=Humitalea sp. 24SJ18S-53 TaxID=3422307 RepID=UPI003D67903E
MSLRPIAASLSVIGAIAAVLPWFEVVAPLELGSVPLFVAMLPLAIWGAGITGFKPWAVRVLAPVSVGFAALGVLGSGLAISQGGASVVPVVAGAVAVAAPLLAMWLWRR